MKMVHDSPESYVVENSFWKFAEHSLNLSYKETLL